MGKLYHLIRLPRKILSIAYNIEELIPDSILQILYHCPLENQEAMGFANI